MKPGQVWEANDPRRLRAVRVLEIEELVGATTDAVIFVENVVTGEIATMAPHQFTVGQRGYTLLQEAA